jgi:hypothetical protein
VCSILEGAVERVMRVGVSVVVWLVEVERRRRRAMEASAEVVGALTEEVELMRKGNWDVAEGIIGLAWLRAEVRLAEEEREMGREERAPAATAAVR